MTPPSQGDVQFTFQPATLGTLTQSNVALSGGVAATQFLASTNGHGGKLKAQATGLKDGSGFPIPNLNTNLSVNVVEVKIKKPKGSALLPTSQQPMGAFLNASFHYDWQAVKSGTIEFYALAIDGLVKPPTFTLNWNASAGTVASPNSPTTTYSAPSSMGNITLALEAKQGSTVVCSTNTTLHVYQDHLERDIANFNNLGNNPTSLPNQTLFTWVCHESTHHAYNNKQAPFCGGQNAWMPSEGFAQVAQVSIDHSTGLPTSPLPPLQRFDVIGYYNAGTSSIIRHSQIMVDGASSWGANNDGTFFRIRPAGTWGTTVMIKPQHLVIWRKL